MKLESRLGFIRRTVEETLKLKLKEEEYKELKSKLTEEEVLKLELELSEKRLVLEL